MSIFSGCGWPPAPVGVANSTSEYVSSPILPHWICGPVRLVSTMLVLVSLGATDEATAMPEPPGPGSAACPDGAAGAACPAGAGLAGAACPDGAAGAGPAGAGPAGAVGQSCGAAGAAERLGAADRFGAAQATRTTTPTTTPAST